jgi:hypothetical protein
MKRMDTFMHDTERRLNALSDAKAGGDADGDLLDSIDRMPVTAARGGSGGSGDGGGGGGRGAASEELRSALGLRAAAPAAGSDRSKRPEASRQYKQQQQQQRDQLRAHFEEYRLRERERERERERDASDSDGSGDDALGRGFSRRGRAKGGRSVVESILAATDEAGSVRGWVRTNEFRSERNRHECEAIAHAVDVLLLLDGVSRQAVGIEILLRRLAGVALADEHGSWGAADAVSMVGSSRSLLPRHSVIKALKEANTFAKLKSGTGPASLSSSSTSGDHSSQWRGKKSKGVANGGFSGGTGNGFTESWRPRPAAAQNGNNNTPLAKDQNGNKQGGTAINV